MPTTTSMFCHPYYTKFSQGKIPQQSPAVVQPLQIIGTYFRAPMLTLDDQFFEFRLHAWSLNFVLPGEMSW